MNILYETNLPTARKLLPVPPPLARFSPRHIGTVSSPLPNDTSVSGIWRSARVRELHTTYLCSRKNSKISTIRAYSY